MKQESQNSNSRVSLLDWALFYRSLGFSVFPLVPRTKVPLKNFPLREKYLYAHAERAKINQWWTEQPQANIGIACGSVSGIVIVDLDTKDREKIGRLMLPPTVIVETHRGYQFYYPYPQSVEVGVHKFNIDGAEGEVRGNGGYIVAPPSVHPGGSVYRFLTSFESLEDLTDFPIELLEKLNIPKNNVEVQHRVDVLLQGVPKGARNDSAARVIGRVLKTYPAEIWDTEAWEYIQWWDSRNKPPLESEKEGELRRIFESIKQRELSSCTFRKNNLPDHHQDSAINEAPPSFVIQSDKEILVLLLPPYRCVVDRLISREGINIISGTPGGGKSLLALYLALQSCKGDKVFISQNFDGYGTTRGRVLIIDEENSLVGIQKRLRKFGGGTGEIFFLSRQNFKIDNEAHRKWLIETIRTQKIDVVIFDSFIRIHGAEENSSKEMTKVYDCFTEIVKETGIAIILIHHNRKLRLFEKVSIESLRGSIDIPAMPESILVIQGKPLKDKEGIAVTVTQVKAREDIMVKPFQIDFYDDDDRSKIIVEYKGEVIENIRKAEMAFEKLCDFLPEKKEGATRNELKAIMTDVGQKAISEALKKLESESKVRKGKRQGARGDVFFWIEENGNGRDGNDIPF